MALRAQDTDVGMLPPLWNMSVFPQVAARRLIVLQIQLPNCVVGRVLFFFAVSGYTIQSTAEP